jgi:hypothetical protein
MNNNIFNKYSKLKNYTLVDNVKKYNKIYLVDKNTLDIYKNGIVTDINKDIISLLINNKFTLHINKNEYYIFNKINKNYYYEFILNNMIN